MSPQKKSLFQQAQQWSEDLAEHDLTALLKTEGQRYNGDFPVGEGGMKKVFGALDSKTGRLIARAELLEPQNREHRYKFIREARISASLQHPNIIPVYDIDLNQDDEPYFTMKLIEGGNLAQFIDQQKESSKIFGESLKENLEIFKRLCEAMAYAHGRGVLHMDLKPENIQVSPSQEVLICDWGMAFILESQCEDEELIQLAPQAEEWNKQTLDGFIKGTPGYMAPERLDSKLGRKSFASDIYALGAIFYEMLTLKKVHEGTVEQIVDKTLLGSITPPRQLRAEIPLALEAICLKALHKDASARYQSLSELQADLDAFEGGFAPKAEEAGFLKQFQLLIKRHKAASILTFSFLLGGTALILFYNWQLQEREQQAQQARISAEQKTAELNKETARRILLGKEAAPRYLEKALEAHKHYRLEESLRLSELVLEWMIH